MGPRPHEDTRGEFRKRSDQMVGSGFTGGETIRGGGKVRQGLRPP